MLVLELKNNKIISFNHKTNNFMFNILFKWAKVTVLFFRLYNSLNMYMYIELYIFCDIKEID